MGMEAAADARLGPMDPIDAVNHEWQRATDFGDGELAAGVSVGRDSNFMN